LNWNDIKFRNDNSILINIKFPITGKKYCPVNLLKFLHSKANKNTHSPVLTYNSGKALTVADFSKDLKILLFPVFGPVIQFLSRHSFRAGIPSALSNCPDIANDNDVCIWGRWSSNSFKAYTKLKLSARKNIFEKILRAISR